MFPTHGLLSLLGGLSKFHHNGLSYYLGLGGVNVLQISTVQFSVLNLLTDNYRPRIMCADTGLFKGDSAFHALRPVSAMPWLDTVPALGRLFLPTRYMASRTRMNSAILMDQRPPQVTETELLIT
ncbi:hypothetical protein OE88DRAFT_1663948 [Heliocybe sulcata]|uniref:Uncharacterized protein n=1 Tax=Heliocybe sulcata TaxID=5364 RepID=A0A5C3MVC0_9AGAM|nr:hypothetical protein OE88DRAFT_1663948 [Heliocybe sulcata]